jgi:DnaB-like helicase N terminal domain
VAHFPPDLNADDPAAGLAARGDNGLVIRAEQALLGAVMSDPVRQAAVLDLVCPGDMARPYHGQVLAAMQRLRARGAVPAPEPVRAELAADPDLPPRVALDGALLAGLLEAAPRRGHAPAYAAMVIDHGIRRRALLAGSRLTQAAEAGELDAALRMTTWGSREVADSQARWEALPEAMRRPLPAAAGHRAGLAEEAAWQLRTAGEEISRARGEAAVGVGTDVAGRLALIAGHVASAAAAARPGAGAALRGPGEARPAGRAAEAAGERFLRDLAAGPGHVAGVRGWLRPGHFARPAHGQLYALMRDMDAAGRPVDPVTVAWEAAHRGIAVDVAELEGGTGPFAPARAREVYQHGLLARISQGGRHVSAAAADPQVQVGVLLKDAGERLRGLEAEAALLAGRPGRAEGRSPPPGRAAATRPPGRGRPRATPQDRDSGMQAEPA